MKNEQRKKYLDIRKNIKNKKEKSEIIKNTLINCDFYKKATSVMVYIAANDEVSTVALIQQMIADKKMLSAPKCIEKGIMEARAFSHISELMPDKFGILAPSGELVTRFDLILVPGVAFSQKLHRLGYGVGYYDRFLAENPATTCGLFFEEQKGDFSFEKHDIPLDFIITDKKIYEKR